MVQVTEKIRLDRTAGEVWREIGKFGALADWHPAIQSLELEEGGALRRLTLADGGQILERLHTHDDAGRTYTYSIVEGPMPVADYRSTLKVLEQGPSACEVRWSGEFRNSGASAEEAAGIIRDIYRSGLDALKR
jgi:hypothetical protein